MNMKSAWIVFGVTLLITLPTRLYQIFFLMDKETGFYTDGSTTTAIISIGLIVGILLIMAMGTLNRQAPKAYSPIHSSLVAVISVLTGLSLIIASAVDLFGNSSSQNHFMYMILSFVGILAGAVFILAGYDFAVGQNSFVKYPLLALLPSLWGCFCLVALFITYVAVVNISENIYDTFTMIFLLLFLFAQAKLLAGVEDQKSSRLIYVFGLPAILLSLVTGIPGVILLFAKTNQITAFPFGLHFVTVLMALYLFVFLAAVRRTKDAPKISSDEPIAPDEILPEQKSETRSPELLEKKNCSEFLAEAYESKEKFVERTQSPFFASKI